MATGYLKITPFDGLFFGKGRPFSIGDESWTEAELLPPPGVVWGALASQLFYTNGGKPPKPEDFKIGPPILMGEQETFSSLMVSAPLDIFLTDEGKKYHHAFFWQRNDITDKSEVPLFMTHQGQNVLLRPHTKEEVELPEQRLISWGDLYEAYISETAKMEFGLSLSSLTNSVDTEYKIGIKRSEDTRSAEEGKLFTVQFSHLKPGMSFLVPYENKTGTAFPESGVLKLGGEGKLAAYRHIASNSLLLEQMEYRQKRLEEDETPYSFFKLLALMPLPLDENGGLQLPDNNGLQVLGGVTGKPILVGGFDYDKRRPKPLKYYAPAGSVWILGSEKKAAIKSIQETLTTLMAQEEPSRFGSFQLFPYTPINNKA